MAYRVSGNKLLDNGVEFQVYGVNATGMEGKPGVLLGLWAGLNYDSYLDAIKLQGFNTLRLPIDHRAIVGFDAPDNESGEGWVSGNEWMRGQLTTTILNGLVDRLEARGFRYFFDVHNLDDNGKIPDYWYHATLTEEQWLWDITTLATRFKGRKGFIGIDFKNEPSKVTWGDGNVKTDWKLAAEKAFRAMNAVNSDLLAIVEWISPDDGFGLKQLIDKPLDIPADRLVLSPHVYGPSVRGYFDQDYKDPSFPANLIPKWKRQFLDVAKTKAVIIGEFGGRYEGQDKTWHDALVKEMKAAGCINFTYWCWSNDSGDTGGILSDGGYRNIRTDKLALLAQLKTDKATFTNSPGAAPVPKPTEVKPTTDVVSTLPSSRFKKGNIIQLMTKEGPRCLVTGTEGAAIYVLYWNATVGEFEDAKFSSDEAFVIV